MYDGLLYIVYSGNKRYYTKLYGSSRFRDPLNRSTCKIEKTRMDPAWSKLTEPNSGFFFLLQKIRRGSWGNCRVCLNGSYGPVNNDRVMAIPHPTLWSKKKYCRQLYINKSHFLSCYSMKLQLHRWSAIIVLSTLNIFTYT